MVLSHYNYTPSLDAAIVVAILYSIAFALTFFLWLKYRAWVWVVMVVAAGSTFYFPNHANARGHLMVYN